MPVDKSGVRADIVMGPESTAARTNLARLYEQEFGAAAHATTERVRSMVGYVKGQCDPHEWAQLLAPDKRDQVFEYLKGYYECISPRQHFYVSQYNAADRTEHIGDVLKDGIYNYIPIDSEKDGVQTIIELKQKYPYCYDTVTYRGLDGAVTESVDPVLIGDMYIFALDKISDTWSAVSTGKLQHFGVLSPRTKAEKTSLPFRETPVTTIGQTEGRIFAGYAGRGAIAEQMDRSNKPLTQRNIGYNILAHPTPSNIDNVVDRNYIPYGSTRPIQLVSHIVSAAGAQITYISGKDTPQAEFKEHVYPPTPRKESVARQPKPPKK